MAKKSSTDNEIDKNSDSGNKKSESSKNSDTNKNSIEDFQSYVKDSFGELKKIHWPTRKQATAETIVVLITVVFLTSLVYLIDNSLSWLFSLIYEQ